MFRRVPFDAITATGPNRKSRTFQWEIPPISEKSIWEHCLEVLAWHPVDMEHLQSLCRIIREKAWKCDTERMIKIYDATSRLPVPLRNELQTMFLSVFSDSPHHMTNEDQEKIHRSQKDAITGLDPDFLYYLCQLTKKKPPRKAKFQQLQLVNDVFLKHASGAWESIQAERFQSILLQNLLTKSEVLDIHVAENLYWQLKKQRRIFHFLKDLSQFNQVILEKLRQGNLSSDETRKAINILIDHQSNPAIVVDVILKLDDMDLAMQFTNTLSSNRSLYPDLYSTASAIIATPPKTAQLYFQAIGSFMQRDHIKFSESIKQCDKNTLQKLTLFLEKNRSTYPHEDKFYLSAFAAASLPPIIQQMPAIHSLTNDRASLLPRLKNENVSQQSNPPYAGSALFMKEKAKKKTNDPLKASTCTNICITIEQKIESAALSSVARESKKNLPKSGDLAYAALLFKQKKGAAVHSFHLRHEFVVAASYVAIAVAGIFKRDTRKRCDVGDCNEKMKQQVSIVQQKSARNCGIS